MPVPSIPSQAPAHTTAGLVNAASGLVDSAASFVPENVPRPAAKTGVAVAGVLVTFWLLQKAGGAAD